jgi:hypothetical protein
MGFNESQSKDLIGYSKKLYKKLETEGVSLDLDQEHPFQQHKDESFQMPASGTKH